MKLLVTNVSLVVKKHKFKKLDIKAKLPVTKTKAKSAHSAII